MKWTYENNNQAHYIYADGAECTCTVPDQVADNQEKYDGKQITVILHVCGYPNAKRKAILDGYAYDLYGPGTGDMVVHPA